MKKKIWGLVSLISIFLLIFIFARYNQGIIKYDDVSSIDTGMSMKEVKVTLGPPKKIISDNKEISEELTSIYKDKLKKSMTMKSIVSSSKDLKKYVDESEDFSDILYSTNDLNNLEKVYSSVKSNQNIKTYIYKIDKEQNTFHIYFNDGIVEGYTEIKD